MINSEEKNEPLLTKKGAEDPEDVQPNDAQPYEDEDEMPDSCCSRCCSFVLLFFYYVFCCCLCLRYPTAGYTREDLLKKFRKFLQKRPRPDGDDPDEQDPLNLLTRLYAQERGAASRIQSCRINPDFRNPVRKDLEFYIPQICTFFLTQLSDE